MKVSNTGYVRGIYGVCTGYVRDILIEIRKNFPSENGASLDDMLCYSRRFWLYADIAGFISVFINEGSQNRKRLSVGITSFVWVML
jgi:hypothetical protein